ncbi:MAG: hypothetical protein M1825_006516 [Sarcosagium campestre]|nr:MAG: hypothetical protein M1825_006516 [Sarcosagium campestre]
MSLASPRRLSEKKNAQYAQELLSTFSPPAIGEVALVPTTGGVFKIEIFFLPSSSLASSSQQVEGGGGGGKGEVALERDIGEKEGEEGDEKERAEVVKVTTAVERRILWDRKVDGGFPETKILKRLVRDLVQPERGLGHIDRGGESVSTSRQTEEETEEKRTEKTEEGRRESRDAHGQEEDRKKVELKREEVVQKQLGRVGLEEKGTDAGDGGDGGDGNVVCEDCVV